MSPEVSEEHRITHVTIVCVDCDQEFVLKAVVRERAETWSNVHAENTMILPQARADWCPFCGKSQKEDDDICCDALEKFGHCACESFRDKEDDEDDTG